MVETAGLENLCAARHRGFESLPLRANLKYPLCGGIFNLRVGSDANCLASRRDSKPAAMSEFERAEALAKAAKGEDREGRPAQNFRQEIYAGQIPSLCPIKKRFDGRPNPSLC